MTYATVSEVKRIVKYPSTSAPVSDADILANVRDAQATIDALTGTKYWSEEDAGTATSGTTATLTDSSQSWTTDEWKDYTLWIYAGTHAGQMAQISSNTSTALTFTPAFSSAVDTTDKFRIIPGCLKSMTSTSDSGEALDGTGLDWMMLYPYPIRKIKSLTIDGTSITVSTLHVYKSTGKIVLGSTSEASYFSNSEPKQIEVEWWYGVYPMDRHIARLCAVGAALMTLAGQIGATYDDFTSIELPGLAGGLGEPYTNIRDAWVKLEAERNDLMKYVRKRPYFSLPPNNFRV